MNTLKINIQIKEGNTESISDMIKYESLKLINNLYNLNSTSIISQGLVSIMLLFILVNNHSYYYHYNRIYCPQKTIALSVHVGLFMTVYIADIGTDLI